MKLRNSIKYPLQIPLITAKIFVDRAGKIFNEDGKEITLEQFNQITGLNIADSRVLSLVTFTHFNLPPSYWNKLRISEKIVGVKSVENFNWYIEEPIESLEYPTFFIHPFFNDYLVNKNGDVIKKSDWSEVIASPTTNGYFTLRLRNDENKTANILRHRFICEVFHSDLRDRTELYVNHKNLVRGDDRIENLEWCTARENSEHFFTNTTIKVVAVEVEMRKIETGEILTFRSMEGAALFLGITRNSLKRWLTEDPDGCFDRKGFQLRRRMEEKGWPDPRTKEGGFQVKYPNDKIIICDGTRAADIVGLTRTSLMRSLREGRNNFNGVRIYQRGRTTTKVVK